MRTSYSLFATMAIALISLPQFAFVDNGIAGRAGSPGETTCMTSGCHLGAGTNGSAVLTSNIPASGYIPGTTYQMVLTVSEVGKSLFGLGIEALDTFNSNHGNLSITFPAATQLKNAMIGGVSRTSVTHQTNGGLNPNSKAFAFNWTAPPTAIAGPVTFYFAGLAANNDGQPNGFDNTYAGSEVFLPFVSAPITVTATTVNTPSCFGNNNGSAIAYASGGSNYSYLWSNGQTTQTATGLLAGIHTVTVTSGANSGFASVNIHQPRALDATIAVSNPITCIQTSTIASVNPFGGTAPYTYLWNNGLQTPFIQTFVAGTYTVTITDSPGCSIIRAVQVISQLNTPSPPQLVITNNVPPSSVGNIAAIGCGAGSVTEYSLFANGPYTTIAPTYTSVPMTIYARCRFVSTGCVSIPASTTTAPVSTNTFISLDCPDNVSVEIAQGASSGIATYSDAQGTTTCLAGGLDIFQTTELESGDLFPIGTNEVCYAAFDGCDNLNTCCFSVIVTPTALIDIQCTLDTTIQVSANSTASDPLTFVLPSATTNCTANNGSVTVTQISGLPNGSSFPIGDNEVCFELADACGNKDTCCFSVIVTPTALINVLCTTDTTLFVSANATTSSPFTFVVPSASTTCTGDDSGGGSKGIATVTVTQISGLPNGSAFPIGDNEICFELADACGNKDTCCFSVIVTPTALINVLCTTDTTLFVSANATTSSPFTLVVPSASTTCTGDDSGGGSKRIATVTVTQISGLPNGSSFPIGDNEVCFELADACGNKDTCCFSVIVTPTALINVLCTTDTTLFVSANATTSSPFTFVVPSASTTCTGDDSGGGSKGIATVTVTQISGLPNGSAFPIGDNEICFELADACGNKDTCCFLVKVSYLICSDLDIHCPPTITVVLPLGQSEIAVNYPLPTAETDCPDQNITISLVEGPTNGTLLPVGTYTLNFLATDACGSSEYCCTTIKVKAAETEVSECFDVLVTPGDGNISINNLPDMGIKITLVRLPDQTDTVFYCFNTCDLPTTLISGLEAGNYRLKLRFYELNDCNMWERVCQDYFTLEVTGDQGGGSKTSNHQDNNYVMSSPKVQIQGGDQAEKIYLPEEEYVIYPNPATDFISVKYTSEGDYFHSAYRDAAIVDGFGRIYQQYTLADLLNQGMNIPVGSLPTGIYFLQLTGSDIQPKVLRFVKR